jgi:hypothetical protein
MGSDTVAHLNIGRKVSGVIGLFALAASMVGAAPARYRLYSKPDPDAQGGITGTIERPSKPIQQILAIPPDEPRLVYEGVVSGSGRREFLFAGLPMRKYDLVVIYEDSLWEGLVLERKGDTLTPDDRQKIKTTIDKAEPYFTRKIIHRLEGATGRGNFCRCICTYMREAASANVPKGDRNVRRTFKLVILKDVGPGWQVVRARDLYPIWTTRGNGVASHQYSKSLSRIRVTRSIKNIGNLNLTFTQ